MKKEKEKKGTDALFSRWHVKAREKDPRRGGREVAAF